jgi:putative transposase
VYCGQHSRSHNGPGHRSAILCRDTKWRSIKYENIYLRAYENGTQLRRGLTEYFDFYNARRTHQALDYQTPNDVYYGRAQCRLAA